MNCRLTIRDYQNGLFAFQVAAARDVPRSGRHIPLRHYAYYLVSGIDYTFVEC
jgi:hypothetical protein